MLSEESSEPLELEPLADPQETTDKGQLDDYLDVDSLLEESLEAEAEPFTEQELNVDVNLEEFSGVSDDDDIIDVDEDKGIQAKLDLAIAYIEIDDVESAQILLQEAIADGNEEQQKEAQEILNRIANN